MKFQLAVIFILIFCCAVFGQQATSVATIYQDEQFPFSIRYPNSWTKITPSAPQVRLRILNNFRRGTAQIGVTVSYRKQNESFAPGEYVKGIIVRPALIEAIISQSMTDAEIITSGKTFLSDQEAFFVKSKGNIKSLDQVRAIVQYQVVMLLEGNQYILHFSDTAANFDRDFPAFEAIAATFSVRPVKAGLGTLILANTPKYDRWRDLIFDVSVPDDAVITLGIPVSDRLSTLPVEKVSSWLSTDNYRKKYRCLEYNM